MPRPVTVSRPQQLERSASSLLHFALVIKTLVLTTSISFITIALLSSEASLHGLLPHCCDRRQILQTAVYVGAASALAMLANGLALLGLHLRQRALLLPYIAFVLFGALCALCYILQAVFVVGFQVMWPV
jgi:hypothetical protein